MSLIGIDVGSSSVKTTAYRENGTILAAAKAGLTVRRPQPGWWENNPLEVWSSTLQCLERVARTGPLRRNPPMAIGISASGREIFPVDKKGSPLGPCIMAGDTRGAELETLTAARASAPNWYAACGHLPERMDPVNRLLWWRRNHPEVTARSAQFVGWHEFLTLRLGNKSVTDPSLAGKWAVYDLSTRGWSRERLAEFEINAHSLPEIQPWGTCITTLKRSLAQRLELPPGLKIAVGGFDCSCAAVGCGATEVGTVALVCGSWADLIVPTASMPPFEVLPTGMSVGPHPGVAGLAVQSLSPNGASVLDWARNLLGFPWRRLAAELRRSGLGPSPVMAIPHFSGATISWVDGRKSRGALLGLTLAASRLDVIKALIEGITYDLALALQSLKRAGLTINLLRASGGGTRLPWWLQLTADLCQVPIEVIHHPEPGTLGAALLAGLAAGVYASLEQGAKQCHGVSQRYEPDPRRAALHTARLKAYESAVSSLLPLGCDELSAHGNTVWAKGRSKTPI
jgi:xylulokinase